MHIPDGLMDPMVVAIGMVEFATVLAAALLLTRKNLQEADLPRVAILSAGIFVAQIINFPIGGGTTGHLIGAALFALLMGPNLAMIGITVVLMIQALLFGDGGITALGLNALNMAIIAPFAAWGVYTLLMQLTHGEWKSGRIIAVGVAAWASVFLATCACAAELAVSYAVSSGNYGIVGTISIPIMLGYYSIIGLGEAAITCGIMAYIWHVSPELFRSRRPSIEAAPVNNGVLGSGIVRAVAATLLVFALLVPLYILYASEGRDGLEQTMEDAGTDEGAQLLDPPFSYGEDYFAILFAGILGFVAVTLLAIGVLKLLRGLRHAD